MNLAILISLGITLFQQKTIEQQAFDYFIEEVYPVQEFVEEKLSFSGQSTGFSDISSIFLKDECFEGDSLKEVLSIKESNQPRVPITTSQLSSIKFFKGTTRRRACLMVHNAISLHDKYFVYITVFKPRSHVDHFLIILEGENINYCHIEEVI